MSLRRKANVSPEELDLSVSDVMALIETGRVTYWDAVKAMDQHGRAERLEGETAYPAWGQLERLIWAMARRRRIAESKDRALTDGRLPGENMIAYNRRMYEKERVTGEHEPDAEMRKVGERIEEVLTAMQMPTTPLTNSTQAPPVPPPAPAVSIGDMRPDTCSALLTLLETMNDDEAEAVARFMPEVTKASDRAANVRGLSALWDRKGKNARNLLTLVKPEKQA